ncbi:MAG: peroxiredoxin family protein, partial [Muribaculaceae bacterium]|nr:peroxiredoxin family protein [Muribaculaceae bacterium]
RYIYLPVDSTETLTVNARAMNFGSDFSISGSIQAEKMAEFEKELQALDFNDKEKREEFKRNVYSKYLKDAQGGIISYYVLTKVVGDKPLYDIQDDSDAKYYAAVATAFEQYRPNDPHAGMLRAASIDALKRKNSAAGKKRVVEAEEIKIIDIALPDENGQEVKLSETMGNGKRGVMIVSMMNEKESPAINKALSELHGSRPVTFYMVSLDTDQYAWRDAAKNLPWVTVSDPEGRNSGIITKYNIGTLPAFFIFDSDGQLVDRAFSLEELNKKI